MSLLLTSHRLVLDRENSKIICYSVSGYGDGISVDVDDFKNMFASPPSIPGYTVTEQAATYKSKESSKHATESYEGRKTLKAASKRQAGEKKLNDTQYSTSRTQ